MEENTILMFENRVLKGSEIRGDRLKICTDK
jgi:hypothetical protein